MVASEVWFIGGPADGRIMVVEEDGLTGPPAIVQLDQTGVFVGAVDQPSTRVVHAYARDGEVDEVATYRYDAV